MSSRRLWLSAGSVLGGVLLLGAAVVPVATAAPAPLVQQVREVFSPDGSITRAHVGVRPASPAPQAAIQAEVTTIQQTGPSDQRFDLVFVGDGYTESELGVYHQHAVNRWNELKQVEPYKSLADEFNVWQVDVVSPESGVDNDPTEGVQRNTALDMYFWCGEIERLLCVDDAKAEQYAALAPQVDQILVLANSTKYGGAGGTTATSSGGNEQSGQIVAHELGHSIGGLADEYDYADGDVYPGPEPTEPNVSTLTADQMASSGSKWASYLGGATPDGGTTGTYEGARYYKRAIYRPSENSLMRTLGQPFNQVSADVMTAAILSRTG